METRVTTENSTDEEARRSKPECAKKAKSIYEETLSVEDVKQV